MTYKDKDKQKQAQREWYLRNKELTYQRTTGTRQKRKEAINQIKEASPCADCNTFFPYYIMQFDHINADEKIESINVLIKTASMEVVYNEIQKCELVCSNCHATRTHKRYKDK